MWAFLAEFGLWILLTCLLVGALLWFGPFLLFRWLVDRIIGRRGVVESALERRIRSDIASLKNLSKTELLAHPEKGHPKELDVAGRSVVFIWDVDPTPPWDDGTFTVVLWHELYVFNLPFAPKLHGVDGFKITSAGERLELTPAELAEYDRSAMSREIYTASIPNTLRAFGFALLIAGLFFKLQHWPWQELFLITAWAVILVGIVWRVALRKPVPPGVIARDLFTFGIVSVVVLRQLHLPGTWTALAVALSGGLAVVWFDRSRFWPTVRDRGSQPLLFYSALAMVLLGTLFRIQHWPYSTALLIGGLVLCAVWFFLSMHSEGKG